ncbi:unnamed protein product, partial [Mesorhabditis belari]|uniref:Splicing factor 45 n=1 Tax=Mesorhabditis belari TaxID=2138241 RepID=A0AAF3EYZ1_9BILA
MALYDDDDEEPPKREEPVPQTPPNKGAANITMKFLQQQLAQKKTNISQPPPPRGTPVVPGVFNLSGQGGAKTQLNIKAAPRPAFNPVRASPINDGVPLKFLPNAAIEDKILLFNEVVIENEYQPAVPNDYYEERKKLDVIEAREKAARDVADRIAREYKEEEKKRGKGAAIAPPTMLQEESKPEVPATTSSTTVFKAPAFTPSFGGKSKGLGVAANIMSKMGYKEGSGLGKSEQGMSTALTVKRVGMRSGQIMSETIDGKQMAPQGVGTTNMSDAMKNPSRVVLLRNMVGRSEVDDDLDSEIQEEMAKYGAVSSVAVHMPEGTPEEEEVRIFVEFGNISQAIKAFIVLSGRTIIEKNTLSGLYEE